MISPQSNEILEKVLETVWCNKIRFNLDKKTIDYHHDNECYWEIVNGYFALMNKNHQPTTIFTEKSTENGKVILIGHPQEDKDKSYFLKEN